MNKNLIQILKSKRGISVFSIGIAVVIISIITTTLVLSATNNLNTRLAR